MATVLSSRIMSESKKTTAVVLTGLLALAGLTAMPSSASASTADRPTIVFDGNTLAISVPATETATRLSADSLSLSTESLARSITTTRVGYTFGGWSLVRGASATNSITTSTTADTTRTLYAVWNTTVNFGTNFADSGSLPGNQTTATYRFGQSLSLPTAGTLVKSGYAFGGWMTTTISANRFTTYSAASEDIGNPTLYAAWIKTVSFNANGPVTGSTPASMVYVAGGARLNLPVSSAMTLRRSGYEFVGWSTSPTGSVVNGPTSYLPLGAQQTLYAIWRVQSTKTMERVFFNPGKSTLRASQKLALRDLVDVLRGKKDITLSLVSNRAKSSTRALGKARNSTVINYLKSLGVAATFVRKNNVTSTSQTITKKVNRVTISAGWTNPSQ